MTLGRAGRRPRQWILTVAAAIVTAASAACGTEEVLQEGVLAHAGGHRLTVDHAAALMAPVATVPARGDVVRSMAELWVDLTLLAEAVAQDSTLAQVGLEPVARLRLEQELIYAVEDTLIPRDTTIAEEDLRRRYAVEAPEVRITAAHILFREPMGATGEERDSLHALALEVQRRARSGEDFGALARAFSQDPGTARIGGFLGTFGRGTLTPSLEEAALSLSLGEVSGPIASPFGLHLLQVTAREAVGYEEGRDAFRAQVMAEMRHRADSLFWADLLERARPTMTQGAVSRARDLAAAPATPLSWWEGRKPLVSTETGGLTADQVRVLFQARPLGFLEALQEADSTRVAEVLMDLTRRELLLEWAGEQGAGIAETDVRRLADDARRQVAETAARMGLRIPAETPADQRAAAVAPQVERALARVLTGEMDPVPLGHVAMRLREAGTAGVVAGEVTTVVEQVTVLRRRD